MNNECIPLKEAAYTQKITVFAQAALVGKTFCAALSGRQSGGLGGLATDPLATNDGSDYITAGPAPANGPVGGVVNWDVAANAKAGITRGAGTILPVTAGAAVAVGNLLTTDASGRVVPAVQTVAGSQPSKWVVGRALSAAAGAGTDVEVELLDPFLY